MEPIYFYKWLSSGKNPLCPVAGCVSEIRFVPWFDERGEKHVQIIKGLWRELREHNTWVYEVTDMRSYSPGAANKMYLIEKNDRYSLQKMPDEIAAALARDPFMPHTFDGQKGGVACRSTSTALGAKNEGTRFEANASKWGSTVRTSLPKR